MHCPGLARARGMRPCVSLPLHVLFFLGAWSCGLEHAGVVVCVSQSVYRGKSETRIHHYSECEILCHVMSHELGLTPVQRGHELFGVGATAAIGHAAVASEAYRVCYRLPACERCDVLRKLVPVIVSKLRSFDVPL